ncbi:MAG TPA: PQQ-dependent sugar dehydrogenase [Nitrososphaeraceae archaeon]|jgi:glucose/arabinose dehydrogenase
MNKYYAYGVRNSFGFASDLVSGNLWESENGPDMYYEINLVKPGFNSGWK